ncbi:response regulator receiver protein [Gloeothece citriformis PCC 7424]|uniref:Response regulator receiver protein n=1 Tax=Gloeothece citriformis (strain PCC 7424) TaxID=65393 RepID=B7KA50_GLOC7|nr:response regulator [Gloeothece citriformis]ACK71406.1 response regulator receiver protein [Gloeothece citriformis PCC 7424]
MSSNLCRVLVIEDEPAKVRLIQRLLSDVEDNSLAQGLSFSLTIAESLKEGLEKLTTDNFDVILLDLTLSDSQGVKGLSAIREQAHRIPIIVQTDDDNLAIQVFQLGADGYLQTNYLDTNLLLYQIRLAIEKQHYIAKLEAEKQQQEFEVLEKLIQSSGTTITARMFGSQPLKESVPDIFAQMSQSYGELLHLALEQQIYKVDHNISGRLRTLADKLGFLKASPRDVIDLHTTTLKEKNKDVTLAKAEAYVSEGRLMVLELMGYLVSFYRKYYIGLSTFNLTSNSDQPKSP